MQTTVTKLAIALAVAGGVGAQRCRRVVGGRAASFAQNGIPHYDSSGAQTAPYC